MKVAKGIPRRESAFFGRTSSRELRGRPAKEKGKSMEGWT